MTSTVRIKDILTFRKKGEMWDEEYLDEKLAKGEFPSLEEMIDGTVIQERNDESEIANVARKRRALYQRLYMRRYRNERDRFELFLTKEEVKALKEKARKYKMSPLEFLCYAWKYFPENHTPTLSRHTIKQCRALLLKNHDLLLEITQSKDLKPAEKSDQVIEKIRSCLDKFDTLTGI